MQHSTDAPPQTLAPPKPEKTGLNRWILGIVIIGIILIAALFSLIYYTNAQISTRTFTYNPPPGHGAQPYSSLNITDVDGLVRITQWSQTSLLINGTITARGLGSTLSTVTISNSSNNGNIKFNADFPENPGFFFSQGYTARINVFIPGGVRFDFVHVTNVNGGVQIDSLNSTNTTISTVNGAITISCVYCLNMTAISANGNISSSVLSLPSQGIYNLTSIAAAVNFSVPASSSFRLTASFVDGSIQVLGFKNISLNVQGYFSHVFQNGGANVYLNTVTGQITITGT